MADIKPTPLPWKLGRKNRIEALHNKEGGCFLIVEENNIGGRVFEEAHANAEHIVKCVNRHDGLLSACRFALAHLQSETDTFADRDEVIERLETEMRKAKGKP